jgi:hypothetical protein
MGGEQGIGKDTLLEPVRYTVAPWNFVDISPKDVFEPYKTFVRSISCA